jgi:PAS domain S-box-containing protein
MEKEHYQNISYLMKQVLSRIGSNSTALEGKFDELPVAMALLDSNGIFQKVNEQYCQFYHYTKEELIGRHFSMIIAPEQKTFAMETHKGVISKRAEANGVFDVLTKAQILKKVQVASAYAFGADNHPQRLGLVIDTENPQQAEKQLTDTLIILNQNISKLRQQIRASETAEGMMMHDLRKPISNMIAMAKIIKFEKLDGDELEYWLELIQEVGKSSLDLMDRYNSLQQMELGDFQPKYTYFDLVALIHEVENKYILQLGEKAIVLHVKHNGRYVNETHHFKIFADRTFIDLLLSNLLVNAIEASPEYESIIVEITTNLAEDKSNYQLSLSVNNLGVVPEEVRDCFFEKFVTSGKERGSGLGTYIARSVALAHGGAIEMTTCEKEGTTVAVYLPNASKPSLKINDVELRKDILGNEEESVD